MPAELLRTLCSRAARWSSFAADAIAGRGEGLMSTIFRLGAGQGWMEGMDGMTGTEG